MNTALLAAIFLIPGDCELTAIGNTAHKSLAALADSADGEAVRVGNIRRKRNRLVIAAHYVENGGAPGVGVEVAEDNGTLARNSDGAGAFQLYIVVKIVNRKRHGILAIR